MNFKKLQAFFIFCFCLSSLAGSYAAFIMRDVSSLTGSLMGFAFILFAFKLSKLIDKLEAAHLTKNGLLQSQVAKLELQLEDERNKQCQHPH